MNYNFDTLIDRCGTGSIKWDYTNKFFSASDILPMWVADMDFRSPEPVIEALKKTAEYGIYGYSGVPDSYYNAIITWMQEQHQWDIEKDWIVHTPGVVAALNMLVTTFTVPGDQVLLQPPVYYPFFNVVKNHGCEILENPLILRGNQYIIDFADLENKITQKTKLIILCSPHNPISRVWTKDELIRLGEICIERNILVISDEIHGDLIYKGFCHVPFASICPLFADNSITCTSASKTFNLPGLQTSNIIISNSELKERFKKTVRNYGFSAPNIFGITATEAAYHYGKPWLSELLQYLERNINFMNNYISDCIPGLKIIQPQGTYLLWLDFRDCGIDETKLGNFVREYARVGLEPGFIFGCKENGFERMNIACPQSILEEGLRRIQQAITLLKKN